jgi:hypothetical protein
LGKEGYGVPNGFSFISRIPLTILNFLPPPTLSKSLLPHSSYWC